MKECQNCGEPLELVPEIDAVEDLHRQLCRSCGMAYDCCDECGTVVRRMQLRMGDSIDKGWGY